ncbi:MAG: EAL domain-containing protein [Nevskia sp.]|nr:EAL domain-containing protein [Nevskia sp.]
MNTRYHPSVSGTILIADDDATARLLMEETLVQAGLQVRLAADGEEALQAFDHEIPDLVLLDVDMPGMDGFEVCHAIRERHTVLGSQVPIVMVTGMDDLESVTRAYDAGATDFISKPVSLPSLVQRVRYMLRANANLQELRSLEERTRAMLSAIPDAMLRIGRDGIIRDYQSGTSSVDILSAENGVGRTLDEVIEPEFAKLLARQVEVATQSREICATDYAIACGAGAYHYEARAVQVGDDEALILFRDITDRKRYERRIHDLAYCDSLTGLPNRQAFFDSVDAELRNVSGDEGSGVAILFMDLDGFKRINDTLGHAVGDHLLQAVTERLKTLLRRLDAATRAAHEPLLARLGGDEFTVLLTGVGKPEDVLKVARKIKDELAVPFVIDSHEISVTTSIGVALSPDDGADAQTLLKNADIAMYHSKDNGRNTCQMYRASLTTRMTQRVTLEGSLRKALERNEFVLFYQPQVHAGMDEIFGMEALIRWQHPERGLVAPGEFIPVAEETGLIVPIGEWVLRTACRQAAQWRADGIRNIRVAVNLCGLQFKEAGFLHKVLSILHETGLPPQHLELELTESLLIDHSQSSIARLADLRSVGIHLSIDDFGTGYSSMSYLKSFPISTLKIDRSFVQELHRDQDNAAITKAIIAMAHSLRMSVIAEGVETAEQAAALRSYGCEAMQGFFYSRPVPAYEATAMLVKGVQAQAQKEQQEPARILVAHK